MGIMRFSYRSEELCRYVDITVTLPTDGMTYLPPKEGSDAKQYRPGMKFQTVYLMHGGGDDDSLVYRYTNAERYADKNKVMLVTPNVANSFGADTEYGVHYSAFLHKELPAVIRALFPSSPKREDNFIVGYAMGGNVALAGAIMYPEQYAACIDMSGGIGYTVRTELMEEELGGRLKGILNGIYASSFGASERFAGSAHDLAVYVRRNLENRVEMPKLTVICGSEEFIRGRLEGDVAAMREMGLDVEYILAEGYDHYFDLWDVYLEKAFNEMLPLRRSPIYPD